MSGSRMSGPGMSGAGMNAASTGGAPQDAGRDPARRIAAGVIEQAATYFVMLQSQPDDAGPGAALLRECGHWRAQHPDHETAWTRVCGLTRLPGAGVLHGAAVRSAMDDLGRRRQRRRRDLLGLMLAGGTLGLGGIAGSRPALAQRIATGTGEQRVLRLPEGVTLELNTQTELLLYPAGATPRALLLRGELLSETAAPFALMVRAGLVELEAGARCMVRDTWGAQCRVSVSRGAAWLRPGGLQPGSRVQGGQRADLWDDGIDSVRPMVPMADAWSQGVLAVERMPLGELVAELARYRSGFTRCESDIETLPISGTFPLDRTDEALQMIAQVLQLRLVYRSRYWVTLAA